MNFASDNTSGASERVLEALLRANDGAVPSYGADPLSLASEALLAEIFETSLAVGLVATGTAANALALGAVVPPGGVVFCHANAHIIDEECAAPEFYTGGGKLVGIPGEGGKIRPAGLEATLRRFPRGVARQAQGACLSLSQATESGTLYTLAELRRLTTIAHDNGLLTHMDGARFANAVAALDCTPAAMSHEAGIDVLSFGTTKNGTLACEAVLVFDNAKAAALPYLRKRGGHVLSKGRFLGAQMSAYLADGHWLALARHANAMARRLRDGLQATGSANLPWPCEVNEVFAILPHAMTAAMRDAGAIFYDWDAVDLPQPQQPGPDDAFVRLVCSFATTAREVDALLKVVSAASECAAVSTPPH